MIKKAIPHICIILSLVSLAFLLLDQFNPSLFGRSFFHVVLLLHGLTAILVSVFMIAANRRA